MAETEHIHAAESGDTDPGIWEPPDPQVLDRLLEGYAVEVLISRSHGGAVYRGIQRNLERVVAIRILNPEAAADASFEKGFREEVRATGMLEHPGITTIHDFGSVEIPDLGERFFVVMEFVPGDTLAGRIESGKLKADVALKMVAQICEALEYAHERDCVHRDIRFRFLVSAEGRNRPVIPANFIKKVSDGPAACGILPRQ